MKFAFVDSSVLLAIAFNERTAPLMSEKLSAFDAIFASPLAEAEVRCAGQREKRSVDPSLLAPLKWVQPDRMLSAEILRVLDAGYVRGADCWHLATALFHAADPAEIVFLTLDNRQREVAAKLGFAT